MHRSLLLLIAVLALVITTGAAAQARWPTADAAYIADAGEHLATVRQAAQAAMQRLSGEDAEDPDLTAAEDFFAGEQAPPKLAPVGMAGHYAVQTCTAAIGYLDSATPDMATSPFAAPMLYSMATNCQAAIHAVDMEIARAVASVGAYPPTPAPLPTPTPTP